ncbi:uncharacterized protein LOC103706492 isoform X2 [Phoenix dactylifera]|nr:uncharacterized protein LOC103706492 isoform X2 [Phoenix dactylifera]
MDDGLFLVTSGLAKEAAVLFQSRRYTECIDVLKQVLQKKEDDPKVLHNIAVAEYCHDGCPDPKKLFDGFDRVKTTALHVCRLVLDIALSSQDTSKAADVIQYLEKSFSVSSLSNQSDNGRLQQQPLNQFKVSGTSNIAAPDASSLDSSACANATENPLVGNLSDEALEY